MSDLFAVKTLDDGLIQYWTSSPTPQDALNKYIDEQEHPDIVEKVQIVNLVAKPKADDEPSPDAVNHPKHYNAHPSGIECLDVVRHMGFNLGNVVKYIWRADLKANAIEDLEKAAFYLQDEIKLRKERAAK